MRIVFFGSSHGAPEGSRRCSSILVDVNGLRYFIDMGTQAIEQLVNRGIDVESVKAIFVTHMHGDHTDGLISFVDLCSWYYKQANPCICLPGDIKRSTAVMKEWIACNGVAMRDFEFRHVDDGFVYCDENIKITAFRTEHTDQSFSYLLEAEGKRVYFSGDLSFLGEPTDEAPDVPLDEFEKGFDLAILELAHFSAVDKYYTLLKNKNNIKTICINHYSKFRIASGYELCNLLPEQKIIFATDGLEIEL